MVVGVVGVVVVDWSFWKICSIWVLGSTERAYGGTAE